MLQRTPEGSVIIMGPVVIFALIGVFVASITDLCTRTVPNILTVPLAISGLVVAAWQGRLGGWDGSLVGLLLGLGLFLLPFSMGWIGGGDVKLLAALGALVGSKGLLWIALYSTLAGGIMALALVIFRQMQSGEFFKQLKLCMISGWLWLCGARGRRAGVPTPVLPNTANALRERYPYALAMAAGTLIAWLHGLLPTGR